MKQGRVFCSINGQIISFDSNDVLEIKQNKAREKVKKGGFKFDIWQSGMDVEEIILTARQHDIPLLNYGIISISKRFNPVIYKYAKKTTHFYYRTKILGRHATVDLFLTPRSKVLHTLSVSFNGLLAGQTKEMTDRLSGILSSKYGPVRKIDRQLFWQIRTWQPNSRISVELKWVTGSLTVTYKDNRLIELKESESKRIKHRRIQKYLTKDKHKF
ncbi:MAG: hypothetical protein GXO58_04955 [Thermodesulfobacteria bacterium]|nr:hypothetical protein [Thermodesulfobacteriota bacterium]